MDEKVRLREALLEIRECIDSFYNHDNPRKLCADLNKYAGIIHVMDKITHEALK